MPLWLAAIRSPGILRVTVEVVPAAPPASAMPQWPPWWQWPCPILRLRLVLGSGLRLRGMRPQALYAVWAELACAPAHLVRDIKTDLDLAAEDGDGLVLAFTSLPAAMPGYKTMRIAVAGEAVWSATFRPGLDAPEGIEQLAADRLGRLLHKALHGRRG